MFHGPAQQGFEKAGSSDAPLGLESKQRAVEGLPAASCFCFSFILFGEVFGMQRGSQSYQQSTLQGPLNFVGALSSKLAAFTLPPRFARPGGLFFHLQSKCDGLLWGVVPVFWATVLGFPALSVSHAVWLPDPLKPRISRKYVRPQPAGILHNATPGLSPNTFALQSLWPHLSNVYLFG